MTTQMTLEFNENSRQHCVDIQVIDDDLIELAESFTLQLLPGANYQLLQSTAVVTISDNDRKLD